MRILFLCFAVLLGGCASMQAADTPRIAVISAFAPELALLESKVVDARKQTINGVDFTTGTLQGKPVVLLLSGMSMVNASMNTQLVIDKFKVSHIVFSGIAGGVNPQLKVGDVVVAQRWAEYLEAVMGREVAPGKFVPPGFMPTAKLPNYGMIFPAHVGVRSAKSGKEEEKLWFDVDPRMFEIARRAAGAAKLESCDADKHCLSHPPRVVIGGNGVSGQAFVDNAAFREYTFNTFAASVLDMETAATAHVAYANGVPFIAFRSLSDLAGGGEGENEIGTFFKLAADNSAKVLLAFLAAWP
jgi:adenosylhomocysteine nucleosidase